jgi:hypothetical protein
VVPLAGAATSAATGVQLVELVEESVFTVLADGRERDSHHWIFNTGASNHMTGAREAFSDLDFGVGGTVRFGDGSIVQIKGCGTILFAYKNGEHQTLGNVYFIPRLTANIISCGQLDEIGYQILVEGGVMHVRDEHMRLLAKIHHNPRRLYVLNIDIACPVCLSGRRRGCVALARPIRPRQLRRAPEDGKRGACAWAAAPLSGGSGV